MKPEKTKCFAPDCNEEFMRRNLIKKYHSSECRDIHYKQKRGLKRQIDFKAINKFKCSDRLCNDNGFGLIKMKVYCRKHFNLKKYNRTRGRPLARGPVYLKW